MRHREGTIDLPIYFDQIKLVYSKEYQKKHGHCDYSFDEEVAKAAFDTAGISITYDYFKQIV